MSYKLHKKFNKVYDAIAAKTLWSTVSYKGEITYGGPIKRGKHLKVAFFYNSKNKLTAFGCTFRYDKLGKMAYVKSYEVAKQSLNLTGIDNEMNPEELLKHTLKSIPRTI